MESTRPIRALTRGLDALTALNLRDGATVSEVAHEIRLPRTTVYRILETLCNAGFIFRDSADDKYRLTVLVRALSGGYDEDAWVTGIAELQLAELSRDIAWPLSMTSLSRCVPGAAVMMVRASTDHATPLALERYSAGSRLPLLDSAAGLTYLAFCPAAERTALLDQALPAAAAELQPTLARINGQGYATAVRTRRLVEEMSLCVPVMLHGRVLAVLGMRIITAAMPQKAALERFLPKLRQYAARISSLTSEQQAEAQTRDAPEAAA
jgi:IclR family transcriptional regulator, mhp operon transcriptional activator